MAIGDGSSWDETNPQQSTLANTLDSYDRDIRIGVRGRMALEHEWPSSQSVTSAAGYHKFITLQNQATKPTLSGTQIAALYTKTVGAGLQELFYQNELGNEVQMISRTGILGGPGSIVAISYTFVNSASGTTAFAITSTTSPNITGGFQVLTITHTPKSATNDILLVVNGEASVTNGQLAALAIFRDTTAAPIGAKSVYLVGPSPTPTNVGFTSRISTIGVTTAVVFTVRAGNTAGTDMRLGLYCGSSAIGADITVYEVAR